MDSLELYMKMGKNMGKKIRVCTRKDGKMDHHFWCPGCDCYHCFDDRWTFDGNLEKPTYRPSLVVLGNEGFGIKRCHSWVTAGKIHYLGDCGHAMAGQVIDMVDIDDAPY